MREQSKREWLTSTKKEWSTPKLREIPLTDEILAHFKHLESTPQIDGELAKQFAARR